MHVSSNHPGRQRRSRRPSLVVTWMLALAGLAGIAHAAEFDEKLTAPTMKSTADFKTQTQAFSKKYAEIRAATPVQLITNASLAKQQFDLNWQVQHAINLGKPLDDLAELGFVSRGDGSYDVDMVAHPEWLEMSSTLIGVTLPDFLDNTVAGLTQRGFRPEDVAKLREYLATSNFNDAGIKGTLPVSLGFGRSVRNHDKLKQSIPDSLVYSYWYQRMRIRGEAERNWAAGLLTSFDAQRQRILMSIVMEQKTTAIWAPDDVAAGIADLLSQVRRADYEQRITAEAKGVAP